jgi:hypothetical protein
MSVSEAQKRASAKYNKEHTTLITIRCGPNDADILEALATLKNKQGYIKSLIRADVARAKSEAEAHGPAQNLKED